MQKNVKKITKNMKKSQIESKNAEKLAKIAKNEKSAKKTFTEEEFYNLVQIAQTYEVILARATAIIGVFLSDEMKKYDFLKEYMAVDRDARKISNRFDKEVKSSFFSLRGKDE